MNVSVFVSVIVCVCKCVPVCVFVCDTCVCVCRYLYGCVKVRTKFRKKIDWKLRLVYVMVI